MNTLDLEDRFMEQVVRGAACIHLGCDERPASRGCSNRDHAQHRGVGGTTHIVSGRAGFRGDNSRFPARFNSAAGPLSWALSFLGWNVEVEL